MYFNTDTERTEKNQQFNPNAFYTLCKIIRQMFESLGN